MGRFRVAIVVAVLSAFLAAYLLRPYVHGFTFVVRASDRHGALRRIAELDARPVDVRSIDIDVTGTTSSARSMPGRLYQPRGRPKRFVLLVSGLHPAGVDEARLVALARHLAETGLAVVTPDIPALSRFEITPALTDGIEGAAVWLSRLAMEPGATTTDGRIGLMGISFSGGLAVVAAGRPSVRDRVAWVLSFGGHDDLPRVLRYLCTGIEALPPGQLGLGRPGASRAAPGSPDRVFARPPHDYAVAVVLLGVADRVVPASQVDRLREAVRRFLVLSASDRDDREAAARGFAELRDLARTLPEPAATLLRYVNDRDVVHLGVRLLPYVGAYGTAPALSPARSAKPAVPVFLLHGSDDRVIPTVEAEYLAADLRGHSPTRLLLSDLISHAEADRPFRPSDVLDLATFWGDVLAR